MRSRKTLSSKRMLSTKHNYKHSTEPSPLVPSDSLDSHPQSLPVPTLNRLRPISESLGEHPFEVNQIKEERNPGIVYYFTLAVNARNSNHLSQSIAYYQQVLSVDTAHYPSLINTGVCFLLSDKLSEAFTYFDRAIDSHPEEEGGYYNKALSYAYIQDYDSAVRTINKLERISPKLHSLKLACIYKRGKVKAALEPVFRHEIKPEVSSRNTSKFIQRRPSMFKIQSRVQEFDNRSVRAKSLIPPTSPRRSPSFPVKDRPKKSTFVSKKQPIRSQRTENFTGRQSRPQPSVSPVPRELPEWVQQELTHMVKKESVKLKVKEARKQIEKENEVITVTSSDIESQNLTMLELEFLIKQFGVQSDKRNYSKLDEIARKLVFFKKFPHNARLLFLKSANICKYKAEEVVFKQGQEGDKMFVILKGSISVEKVAKEFGNNNVVVNSLYDGSQFGELALISGPTQNEKMNKRNASCVASEETIMMTISKLAYLAILRDELGQDIESKVLFFSRLPFFVDVEPSWLIAMASNIEPYKYEFNDTIIKKGEKPEGLYIVYKGHAVAYTEGISVKSKYPSDFANPRKRRPKPKPFRVGKTYSSSRSRSSLSRENSFEVVQRKETKPMPYESRLTENDQERIVVKDKIPFSIVKTGDYFGCRALIGGQEPSKFTIIVESHNAEVFVIKQTQTKYLPPKVAAQMQFVLGKSYDLDCPDEIDPVQMDKMMKYWQGLRERIVEDIRREKYVDKRKAHFPFMCN